MCSTNFKSSRNIVYSCKYHLVVCPKYRRLVPVVAIARRLDEIIRSVALEKQVDSIEMEIMPDHVHGLCEIHPEYGLHDLVKLAKGQSSCLLRSEFPALRYRLPTLWTNAYLVSTVGGAPLEIIQQYIEDQKRV